MITGATRGKYLKLLAIVGVMYAVAVIALMILNLVQLSDAQRGWLVGASVASILYHALLFMAIMKKFGRYSAYATSIVITSTVVTLFTLATGGIESLNNISMIVVVFGAAMLGVGIAAALVWVQVTTMVTLIATGTVNDSFIVLAASWGGLFAVSLLTGWILLVRPVRALEQESIDHLRKTLMDERLRSEGLISAIDDGIVIISKEGIVRHANKQFLQMIDLRPSEMIDKPYLDIASKRVRIVSSSSSTPQIGQNIAEVFRTGKPMTIDAETIEYLDRGGQLDLSISVLPLKNEDDEINVVMLIARDITKLMDVQRMKDDFISLASHELRTPATVISGYADLLLNPMFGDLTEKQRHYATRAKESTTLLVDLVNDMLDMSRLESGRRPNSPEEVDISAVITEVIQSKQALQQSKGVTVRYDHTKQIAVVDKDRLRQLLEQLLANAIVFTPTGGEVTIEVTKHASDVQVSVSDQGLGIPEQKRQVIFEKFTKLDDSGEISGTGLGLAICKKITQDWGGTIAVHAKKTGGSEFNFTIPTVKQSQSNRKQRPQKTKQETV